MDGDPDSQIVYVNKVGTFGLASLVLVSPVGLGDVAHHRVGYLLVSLEL